MAAADRESSSRTGRAEVISGREIGVFGVAMAAMLVIAILTSAFTTVHNVFVMALVPAAIVAVQAIGLVRWRRALVLGAFLLDLEALLAALNFASGPAFAVLLPVLSVRVAQLQPDRRLLRLTGVAALATCLVSLMLAITVGPISERITLSVPLLGIMLSMAATIGLLEWVFWRRLDRAEEAEHREMAALEQAERAALAASAEVRGIIDATADALVVVDADGRIRDVNEAAVRLSGRTRRGLIGVGARGRSWVGAARNVRLRRFLDLLAPVRVEPPTAGLHRLTGRRADGSVFPAEVSVNALKLAGRPAYVAAIRDISERLALDEDLRSTREMLAALVAAAPLAVMSLDMQGVLRYFNPAAERLLGWPASEAIGRNVSEVTGIGPQDYESFRGRILAGATIDGWPVERRTRDGRAVRLRLFVAPLRDADGSNAGAVILMEDVTERHALEAQLRQAQKMETLGQLSGAIAHDFNNLLQAIHGYAELAAGSAAGNLELLSHVQEIERAAGRAADLTRQLLTFSQPGLGQARVVNLDQSVAAVLPMIDRLLGPNIELVTLPRAGEGSLLIDPAQLEQAILNLVVNARDAMPEGGTLTIETGTRSMLSGEGPDAVRPALSVTVRDTGSGIGPEIEGRIFEPFFTTKQPGQGSGLGLAIVFGVVRGASGEIELESEPGRGTAFTLVFPAAQAVESKVAEPAERWVAGTETVLLVEDEEAIRRLAERILEANGYRVLSAPDATAARELWESGRAEIGLLLSDITLPGISGPTLAGELAAEGGPMRMLFMSGRLMGDPSIPPLPPGARFLPKPFSVASLLAAVRAALDAPPSHSGG
jgi:PAS domain S-box-containing protein